MFSPPPRYSFEVVKERVGRYLTALIDLTFRGEVQHVDQVQLLVLPITNGEPQRLAITGSLPCGGTVVIETTLELFRAACRELGEEH